MQLRVILEAIEPGALIDAATEAKTLGVPAPGNRSPVGAGFGLGQLQQLHQSLAILAQQLQWIRLDAQAHGGAGNADNHQHHHQFDQGETALFAEVHARSFA
ncbi:hypothetical protein D3C80_1794080 [compost metagenome]